MRCMRPSGRVLLLAAATVACAALWAALAWYRLSTWTWALDLKNESTYLIFIGMPVLAGALIAEWRRAEVGLRAALWSASAGLAVMLVNVVVEVVWWVAVLRQASLDLASLDLDLPVLMAWLGLILGGLGGASVARNRTSGRRSRGVWTSPEGPARRALRTGAPTLAASALLLTLAVVPLAHVTPSIRDTLDAPLRSLAGVNLLLALAALAAGLSRKPPVPGLVALALLATGLGLWVLSGTVAFLQQGPTAFVAAMAMLLVVFADLWSGALALRLALQASGATSGTRPDRRTPLSQH